MLLNEIKQSLKGNLHIVFGTIKDKPLKGIFDCLPINANYYWTQSSVPRTLLCGDLQSIAAEYGFEGLAYTDVNIAIEAVGRPETYEQAFYARDHAGTVVLVGVPSPDMKIELPLIEIFGRGGSLKSSWYGDCLPTRDFPMFIDLYLQGRLDLDRFVSETIALDEVEEAFHKMERGEVLRSVVVI